MERYAQMGNEVYYASLPVVLTEGLGVRSFCFQIDLGTSQVTADLGDLLARITVQMASRED